MKYKEYFSKLKEQGGINNEDYNKFLDSVADGELPDAVFQLLENTFITPDRAVTHPEVDKKMRHNLLNPVDQDIKELLKFLPAELVLDIENEKSTYKKMETLKKAIPAALQKAGKAPEDADIKKKLAEKQSIIDELTQKFEKANGEWSGKEQKLKADYDKQFTDYKLDSELEKMANSYTFADAYKDTRPAVTKALLSEIRAKHHLELATKDGQTSIQVMELGEDGKPRGPKFNGNTPVTIQTLLEEPFKPFLKQNNADQGQNGKNQATHSYKVENPNPSIRRGANTSVEM